MALGDLMASRLVHSSTSSSAAPSAALPNHNHHHRRTSSVDELPVENGPEPRRDAADEEPPAPVAYLPQVVVLCEQRHEGFDEAAAAAAGPSTSGLVTKWRPKDRMKTGCVALVLCLNVSVDPPDVIKISPCARKECWIDPFSMAPPKALETIGKTLHSQYERWQPKARYKLQLDPTLEEVKKLCNTCRKFARTERVLFHYNGHGVPKPTANGEIWVFNKSYTQYIPLPITDLDSWLKTPSIYVFDCSAAGMIVKAFLERLDWSSSSSGASMKDCILLAACEAHQTLPQSAEFPADVFTACLTTPIKMALHWFCKRSLLRDSMERNLIDQIPGRQNDRKTLLGELNWIFTAITDTIAWNVLPHDLFQRLFRQDLLVASLFRNFLLAERIMRSANCSPISYPLLPPTHQHHMWDAWDMAAEICLSKLPQLIADPNAEFQPSPFFTEQLTAFEVWLDHGSEDKKPPEQLPIYASGDMSSILVWDLDKEQLISTILSTADSGISALSTSQVQCGQFAAGFVDASVRIFDVRTPDRLVYMARPHAPRSEKVVGIGFQPGFDPYKIVSASQAGDIQFLDVRRASEPYLTIEAHRGSLTALAVHRHAPVIASGSAKQMIKVFSLEGEQLTIIRYQPSFMGQRIGSVNCLSFHPYKSLLAAGAGDNALVSIYAEDNYQVR
uniref:Raptor N-terminal CASPase-like domain-containing protein n=1 Tax=Leersia perrieri TaxID=77586 RepID=A0A0D9XNB4_9ORYZ